MIFIDFYLIQNEIASLLFALNVMDMIYLALLIEIRNYHSFTKYLVK